MHRTVHDAKLALNVREDASRQWVFGFEDRECVLSSRCDLRVYLTPWPSGLKFPRKFQSWNVGSAGNEVTVQVVNSDNHDMILSSVYQTHTGESPLLRH